MYYLVSVIFYEFLTLILQTYNAQTILMYLLFKTLISEPEAAQQQKIGLSFIIVGLPLVYDIWLTSYPYHFFFLINDLLHVSGY